MPGYGTVDGGSGVPARSFGTEIGLLADREIIPGKLIAAVNVGFAFSTTRLTVMDAPVRGSGIEVAGALAYCVRPGLFLGGEARYARTYDGLALDRFAGEAVYPRTDRLHDPVTPGLGFVHLELPGRRAGDGRARTDRSVELRPPPDAVARRVQLLTTACGLHRGCTTGGSRKPYRATTSGRSGT
ncbi:hypothetical protein ACU4GR_25755 [Methylobacterium oryzae CBMB20]